MTTRPLHLSSERIWTDSRFLTFEEQFAQLPPYCSTRMEPAEDCPTLTVDGLELEPVAYRSSRDSEFDTLSISAVLHLDEEKHRRLWDAHVEKWSTDPANRRTLPVTREGIDDEPVAMRFGSPNWSEHEGQYKWRITMVEEEYDRLLEESDGRISGDFDEHEVVRNRLMLEDLLAALTEKGILENSEVPTFVETRESRFWDMYLELIDKVEDVDKLYF